MTWNCLPRVKARSKRKATVPQTSTIEFYTGQRDARDVWRIARLSFDFDTDVNLISPRLVTEVLGLVITPLEHKDEYGKGQNKRFQGYVDLTWCFYTSRKICGPMRWMVTTAYDPPFDAVLGRKDYKKAGITRDCG